jgi:hypothetical protein
VTRQSIAALALLCAMTSAPAGERPAVRDDTKPQSMRFEWRTEGPAESCGRHCRTWIAATGVITEATAREFEKFTLDNDVRGATLVLDSEGGSVLGALALGRAVRMLGLTTAVGRTTLLPADGSDTPRAVLSPKATCESMCAFLLLGGARRYVPPEARVQVHMIWLGSKSKRALEASYSADELGLVQRDIGKLARYTVEMGGSIELLETALKVPPWEPMHTLSADELRRMRVTTVDYLFEPELPTGSISSAPPSSPIATAAQGQHKD